MRLNFLTAITCFVLTSFCAQAADVVSDTALRRYADRASADTLNDWRALKFGLFIHWGLYSIPAGVWDEEPIKKGYSEQIMAWADIPRAEYAKLAEQFTAAQWDPDALCLLAKQAGMKYIVITSKHHDGFCLFHTETTTFNTVDATPFGRDVVGSLAEACKRHGLKLGLYFSNIDWSHPEGNTPEPQKNSNPIPKGLEEINVRQLRELTTQYGELAEIWFDMGAPTWNQSVRFAQTVRDAQPHCAVSGRVWNHQGDFTVVGDNVTPEAAIREPWQSPETIYHKTWGYRTWQERLGLKDKIAEKIEHLSKVASLGGVYLLNIGPRGDGSIVEFEADVLRGVGEWMQIHKEAIHGTEPQPFYENLPYGCATFRPRKLYLHVHDLPEDGSLPMPGLYSPVKRAYLLHDKDKSDLTVRGSAGSMAITLSSAATQWPVQIIVVELEGPLDIRPPQLKPEAPGLFSLNEKDAYRRIARNGPDCFSPGVTTGYTWDFSLSQSGTYKIVPEILSPDQPCRIELLVDGTSHILEVDASAEKTISVETRPLTLQADCPIQLTVQSPSYVSGEPVGVRLDKVRIMSLGNTLSPPVPLPEK